MSSAKILLVSGFAVLTAGALSIRGTVTSPKQQELQNTVLNLLADGSDRLPKPNPPMLVADGSDPLPRPNPPAADGSDPLPRPNPPTFA